MLRTMALCILLLSLPATAVRAGEFPVTATASSSYDERHGPQATLDGLMRNSFWAGRPGQKEWTLTYAFPAPARLGKVTVAFFDASGKKSHTPKTVRTEITIDGKTWVALEKQPIVGAWTGGAYRPLVVEPADALMGIRFVLSAAPTGKQPSVYETQFFDTSGKLLSPGKPLAGKSGGQVDKPQPDADGIIVDRVTYASTLDDTSPLTVYAQYPKDGGKLPLLVAMHGYSEPAGMYVRRTRGYAEDGFFVACVAMRGRDGSAGKHDSGGKEIHDVYDAVEALKRKFPDRIDPQRVGHRRVVRRRGERLGLHGQTARHLRCRRLVLRDEQLPDLGGDSPADESAVSRAGKAHRRHAGRGAGSVPGTAEQLGGR